MGCQLSRRRFLGLASIVGASMAGASLLGACAPKAEPEPTPAAPPEAPKDAPAVEQPPPAPAGEEQVVLQLHLRAGGDLSEPAIYVKRPAEFMEEHPNIKVELSPIPGAELEVKLLTLAVSGTLGDVTFTHSHVGFHQRIMRTGMIAVVDDFLEAHGKSKDEWVESAVDTLSMEGKMYGLPKCAHPSVAHVWINEDMFQDAGFDVPEVYDHTHDDILEWAEAMAKGPESDREVYGYACPDRGIEWTLSDIRAWGGYLLNEAGTECLLDSEVCYKWADWNNHFFQTNLAPETGEVPTGGLQALFAASKLAMVSGGRWNHKRVVTAVEEAGNPFTWKVIQAPREANANLWISAVDTHSATTQSKNPDEAFLLSYALADKRFTELVAKDTGYLTARRDDPETIASWGDPFLDLQAHNTQMTEAIRQPVNFRGTEMWSVMNNEMAKLWLGDEALSESFMAQAKAAVEEVLAKPM
jgi:ABC-type glycerol-3-phosphate transport system substrate-binding protein